jgi:catechol 2,3-dioxygenase-like lactoylglutathione lyase family enzyme
MTIEIRGLTWAGTRTGRNVAMTEFLRDVLGIPVVHDDESGFSVHRLPDGARVEVFPAADAEHEHFTTGPVPGFLVDDVHVARAELAAIGIELLGSAHVHGGDAWQHFRAPDGNVWEVVHHRS